MRHVIAISGGKDSTAMALRLVEIEPREYDFLITPTGDELPEMIAHWENLEHLLGKPFIRITSQGRTLNDMISEMHALPSFRMRWCTRRLKILPTIEWIRANNPVTMYVGLRADEELREGIYAEDVVSDYPLRRWGWGIRDVVTYLKERGVCIPMRTDCARCCFQRLKEWRNLWRDHPGIYWDAARQEQEIGATFRSPNRDTWPADLVSLAKEFESGRRIRGDKGDAEDACRVCRL